MRLNNTFQPRSHSSVANLWTFGSISLSLTSSPELCPRPWSEEAPNYFSTVVHISTFASSTTRHAWFFSDQTRIHFTSVCVDLQSLEEATSLRLLRGERGKRERGPTDCRRADSDRWMRAPLSHSLPLSVTSVPSVLSFLRSTHIEDLLLAPYMPN